MKFKIDTILICVLGATFFLNTPTNAFDDVELKGKFKIVPKISSGWQVDGNFFKSETDEREVHTYSIDPGFEFGYETAKSGILFDYTLRARFYDYRDEKTPENRSDDRDRHVGHDAVLMASTMPFDRVTIGFKDSFYKTVDPGQADRFSDSVEREDITTNTFLPEITYRFGERFSAKAGYQHKITRYERENVEDSTEHRGMLDMIYHLTRKFSADLQYQHWKMDYNGETVDYDSDEFGLYLNKQFKYFAVKGGAGYHHRKFDGGEPGDQNTFLYRIALRGQNPPAPNPNPQSAVNFSVERNFNNYAGTGNNYYEVTQFDLSARHIFMEKILTTAACRYRIINYETWSNGDGGTREDDVYDLSVAAGYLFTEWLTFRTTVGYEERDSNFAGYSYDNTYFKIEIESVFDLGSK